jgi:hypothetical protein
MWSQIYKLSVVTSIIIHKLVFTRNLMKSLRKSWKKRVKMKRLNMLKLIVI